MAFRSKIPLYQQPVFKALIVEGGVVVLLASLFLFIKGVVAGYSAVIGGLIAFLPNAYFAVKVFRYFGARSMPMITASLWAAEAAKFALTVGLFVLVFMQVKPLNEMALFITYSIMLIFSAMLRLLIVKKGLVE